MKTRKTHPATKTAPRPRPVRGHSLKARGHQVLATVRRNKRYLIPSAALLGALTAAGFLLRERLISFATSVASNMSFDSILERLGLERYRSLPVRTAPALGTLAVGIAAGSGATFYYMTRVREAEVRKDS